MQRRVKMKPGKGNSLAGLVVGIIFCLLGIFMVIPTMGIFGVFWTGMALVITVINGINAFSEDGLATHEIYIEDTPDQGSGSSADKEDPETRLRSLKRLREEGLITEEEYETRRKEIIQEI